MNRAPTAEGEIKAELARPSAVVPQRRHWGSMIVLIITVLLAATGIAVMPCWRYSAGWGYGPGVCVGLLLVGIGISAVHGRVSAPARSMAVVEASVVDPIRSSAISASD